MATKHWGRDAYYNNLSPTYGGNQVFASILLYHMLRVAGFEWLWECDGEVGPNSSNPNHCDDGNMEEAGTTKYVAVGPTPATISKDTTQVHSGAQSLKVVSTTTGDGVRTIALLSITNPTNATGGSGDRVSGPYVDNSMKLYWPYASSREYSNCRIVCSGFTNAANNGTFVVKRAWYYPPDARVLLDFYNGNGVYQDNLSGASWSFQRKYTIAIWARNTSGNAWNVEVDPGDATYVNVGTIPVDSGGWKLYFYHFWAVSTGSRYIRITDPTGGNTIYLDGILVFRSMYEYAPGNVYGTDGKLTNPDLFSTGGSYTCGAQDIGKWLFVWDPDHNKNTGYYKILGDNGGGVIKVDMRSRSAQFTTHSVANLNWRIVNIEGQSFDDTAPIATTSMGFGLKSPHSSGWRYFSRGNYTAYDKPTTIWCAPNDEADFNWSTGQFYMDGPSTQRNLASSYTYNTYTNVQDWCGLYLAGGDFTTRDWFMTDENRSFFTFIHINASFSMQACFFVGYVGADSENPGIQEFVSMAVWNDVNYSEIGWSAADDFSYSGITFDPNGFAVPCGCEVLGYGSGTSYVAGQSNSSPNPWSGKEIVTPFVLVRDPAGRYGCGSERNSNIGLYNCRANMPNMTGFNANLYLRFISALAWEWDGDAVI